MIDQATWEFINSFSGWVSGIGSLCAVIVALYLAGKDRRVKVEISADIITVIGPIKVPEEKIGIRLFNPNRRAVQVNLICWRSILKRKGFITQSFMGEPNLPVQIEDGRDVVFTIPMKYMLANLKDFEPLLASYPKLMIHFIRIVVVTSTGKNFTAKLGSKLHEWILRNIHDERNELKELSEKRGS